MHLGFDESLSLNFLKSISPLERLPTSPPRYLVEHRDRILILERRGTCDYDKCEASCCRMLCVNLDWNEYLAGFAEQGMNAQIIHRSCRYLLEDDWTCRRWDRRDFPRACINFPVPGDPLYLEVMEVCSFFFVFLQEIKIDGPMERQTD